MKQNLIYIALVLFLSISNSYSQTKSHGNYEIYTYEDSRNGIGYLSTDINYPTYLNSYVFEQKGLMYTYQYFSNEIGSFNLLNNFRLRFITEGNFNIGGGYSSTILNNNIENSVYREELKMYTAKLDVYSFDVGTEATYVFPNGLAVTAKFGMNIFSLGANAAMPQGGTIKDDIFGVVNLVPLIFRPQLLIDFGRSVFGIGFMIHTKNFVEYKYVPTSIFNDEDKGIIFNDDFMTNYAIQLFFRY